MGFKEELQEKKGSIEARVSLGFDELRDMADSDLATMQKYAGIADEYAAKLVRDKAISTEIRLSDSPDLKMIKQAMVSAEASRLSSVKKTSDTIRSVTMAAAAVGAAIYPPAGVAIMLVGTIANMAYNFYSSSPGPDWTRIVQSNWGDYQTCGLPYPSFVAGFDNIQGYAQDKLQRATGFGGMAFMDADTYEAQADVGGSGAWWTGQGGGYLGTSRGPIYRAVMQHAQALRNTRPPDLPGIVEPLYQASPLLAFDFQAFGAGSKGVPVWWWWLDNNLCLCSNASTPVWVEDYADMQAADRPGYSGEVLPPNPSGMPMDRLRDAQKMMDVMIRQVCITCAMGQNVPVWAAQPVIDAGKKAWAEYRKSLLPLYAAGNNEEIGKLTGLTQEGNLVGKLGRRGPAAAFRVPRGINGIDAMGYVMIAAMNKAEEIASTGLTLQNIPLLRPAWVEYARKGDFQAAGAAEIAMQKGMLELSPAAKAKLQAARLKGATQAFIIPADRFALLKDMPQYVPNRLAKNVTPPTASRWSTGVKVAAGLGGAALLGGGGYYLYQRGR